MNWNTPREQEEFSVSDCMRQWVPLPKGTEAVNVWSRDKISGLLVIKEVKLQW